ncbi:hypothetical protein BC835DRAFT_1308594 [Cytidiella melzeri]|nr:hypothetical protein BC835DRAFT_1308594 [Cytidiella melzeri]
MTTICASTAMRWETTFGVNLRMPGSTHSGEGSMGDSKKEGVGIAPGSCNMVAAVRQWASNAALLDSGESRSSLQTQWTSNCRQSQNTPKRKENAGDIPSHKCCIAENAIRVYQAKLTRLVIYDARFAVQKLFCNLDTLFAMNSVPETSCTITGSISACWYNAGWAR